MKTLTFHYQLKIHMDAPVSAHRFTLRCIPLSDARQRITLLEQHISPADFLSESQDSWGNALVYGVCRREHTDFEASIQGQAEVGLAPCVPSVRPGLDFLLQYPTALTAADESIRQFAQDLHLSGNAIAKAEQVMEGVHSMLQYTPGTTTVSTTAAEAFAGKQGVCQDYAHVMLAVLRSQSIPCRYVAGMLLGEGESHAWVEVLHESNWYAFDPTGCRLVTDAHIKLSHGRDFWDCTINRGLFRGFANQSATISAIVSDD